MKIIKYYTKSQYGNNREFVHDDNASDAASIASLTGQKCISPAVRAAIESLCGDTVKFEEVIAPKN